ncbi:MAG: YbaB/EbfC family nucleoid-associated protein [Planctomycetes bacterium]|nr:YbaB/EbfC family nucleoid-associated protein [Planctomycetota bacterium]
MLNQMKLMGVLAGLMKNQDRLEASAQRVRAALSATRVTGEAGGGAARATFTCDMKLVSVELSPSLACGLDDDANRAEAEALVTEAVNDGLARAQETAKAAVAAELDELGLTELLAGGALSGLSGLLP